MYHKKFIFMFVGWCCVNTVNCSPISFEDRFDCGNRSKIDRIGIEINERQGSNLKFDSHLSALRERVIPKRAKRQTNNDPPGVLSSTLESIIAQDDIEATNNIDYNVNSIEITLPPEDETDFTITEYKKAEENLLSASDQVKVIDGQFEEASDDDTTSNDNLLDTNFPAADIQDIKEIETVEGIQPQNNSTSSIRSPTEPNSSMTEITTETKEIANRGDEKETVKDDGEIESGSLSEDVWAISSTAVNSTTETTPIAYDSTNISSKTGETSNIRESFNEPIEAEFNGIKLYKSDNITVEGEENLNFSGISVDKTALSMNMNDVNYTKPTADDDTKISVSEDPIENNLNGVVIDSVIKGEMEVQRNVTEENIINGVPIKPSIETETDGGYITDTPKAPEIFTDPRNVSTSGESHHNATDELPSISQDTTKKLDVKPNIQDDKINMTATDVTQVGKSIETNGVPKKDTDVPVNPNSSNDSILKDNELYSNNSFITHYETHIYSLDDWDDDTNAFDDVIEDPCDCCDCGSRNENSKNFDEENDPTTDNIDDAPIEHTIDEPFVEDYSTNYGNVGEHFDKFDDSDEYKQHNHDNSRDFLEHFDSEDDLDDLFNSDIEFNTRHDTDFDRFDEVTDEFDVDDIFR